MSRKSIGQLHSTVTANASQFVNEFQRADNAQRRASASIRAGVSRLTRDLQREFSIPKLAKGVMAGFGIGGGMQAVQMGMDKFAEMWRESSEQAKDFAEHAEKIRETMRELGEARFNTHFAGLLPGAKPAALETRTNELRRQLAEAEANYAQATRDIATAGKSYKSGPVRDDTGNIVMDDPYGGRFGDNMGAREIAEEAFKRQTKAAEEMDKLRQKLSDNQAKLSDITGDVTKAIDKALDDFFKPLEDLAEKRQTLIREKLKEFFDPLDERSANVRELMKQDPMESKPFRRWEAAAGTINVDDMTRRGLGTGANYKDVMSQTNSILAQILDAIRDAKSRQITASFAN